MSKIKVDDIAPSSSNTPSITLGTNSNVSFANGVTATSFTGDGANLTNVPAPSTFNAANLTGTLPALSAANLTSIPAANITGTLPAFDGSNLNNVGCGSLEFVKKIEPSSAVSSIVETGLDYDRVYRLVFPSLALSAYGGVRLKPHVDNSSTPHMNSDCCQQYGTANTYANTHYGQSQWSMYPAIDRNDNMAVWELYTGARAWMTWTYYTFGSSTEPNGLVEGAGWKVVASNTNQDSNQTGSFAKVNGFTIEDIYGANINPGTKLLIYKYKES